MNSIEKGFGEPPTRVDSDDTAKTPDDLRIAECLGEAGQTDGQAQNSFEPYSPGNPAPNPSSRISVSQGRSDRSEGDIIRRETLRPTSAPYLHAVNEAYQPIIEAEDEEGLDIARYWRVIRRHKWGILTITLIALLIGFLNAQSQTPIYRATTTLVAEPFERKISVSSEYISNATFYQFYDTQFQIIKSRTLAELVVDQEKLVEKRVTALKKSANERPGTNSNTRTFLDVFGMSHWFFKTERAAQEIPRASVLRAQLTSQVQNAISVSGGAKSQIVRISFDNADKTQAAELANAVARAYVAYSDGSKTALSQHANRWLDNQLRELKDILSKSEDALLNYQQRHGLVGREQSLADSRAGNFSGMLAEAKNRSAEAKLRWEQVDAVGTVDDRRYTSSKTLMAIPSINQLAKDERSSILRLSELSTEFTAQHPDLIRAQTNLEETRKALGREIALAKVQLRQDYELALAQEKEIRDLIREETGEVSGTTASVLKLAKLERDVENNRRLYEALLSRIQETDMAEDYQVSNIRMLDKALVPNSPYKPNKEKIVLIAGVLGAVLGLILAFVRDHIDRTLKTMDDIEEKLGLTALGLVPFVKSNDHARPETTYQRDPRSAFAEKINHIRTGLTFTSIDNPPRSILITSSTGGEGKTTTAINLATAFSQLDKTLLLEVDLRKGNIPERLSIAGEEGLTDLIANPALAAKIILRHQYNKNLYILPCGTKPPNPLEVLSSQQFQLVLKHLHEHFRYILLDGPPLLAVSDAAVMGHLVDATILVAQAEKTSPKMIKDATAILRKAKIQPTGVILTKADTKRMAYYGGHYYYYDKRYYGEGHEAEATRS